uniref:LamG domain-containing protein n=1 Tax=Picocystis salinarum TaxID=88271 RepID=A0A7S3XGU4_9CHLO|mmetsp:Transcript_7892/g.48794  ORF Transcript_7892/g.48794 Transcript_7892/m.48794 type:complete len:263 (+) Transcript_7892:318-1106(+)
MQTRANSFSPRWMSFLVLGTVLFASAWVVNGSSVSAHSVSFSTSFEEVNKTCTVNAEADPVEMTCTSYWKGVAEQPASITSSLTLSRSVGPGTFSHAEALDRDIVFECDVVFPSSVGEDVMLFNHGAGGRGTWVGLMAQGASGLPVMTGRAGDGGRLPRSGTARFETSDIPLDGQVHNVVVDIRIAGPGRIRLFIDGSLKAQGFSTDAALQANQFSGGSNPAYGSGGSTPNGKTNREWPGFPQTLMSELKIYDGGQLVPSTA